LKSCSLQCPITNQPRRILMVAINQNTDAFMGVDIQATFMPGGGLAVAGGNEILQPVLKMRNKFMKRFATQDWHPIGHISLASSYVGFAPNVSVLTYTEAKKLGPSIIGPNAKFTFDQLLDYLLNVRNGFQVLWSDHGIQGTAEAAIHPEIDYAWDYCEVKGTDPLCDSYSGITDNLGRLTRMVEQLRKRRIKRVFCAGLAFDYCVGATAIDAVLQGFEAFVIKDCTRSVGIPENSIATMEAAFVKHGVTVIESWRELEVAQAA
jgi:nicotinamidase/pyrazinamidase